MEISQKILSDITVYNKYAKFIPEIGRRENWDDICDRNVAMHCRKYPALKEEIRQIYNEFVRTRKVLPSMRSMQFAGQPIELNSSRIFNCGYLAANSPAAFWETMFLLLGGTGIGYSVQAHHIEQLPIIKGPTKKTRRYLVGDSIEGWADAVRMLVKSYTEGRSDPVFDFRGIRPKGAMLITSGGKAPGPDPLRICLDNLRAVLNNAVGRKLTSLECHDMMCHIADAVLAGGIRRAALICLFDNDDLDMLSCKTGDWWECNPQRGRANNSVVLVRGEVTEEEFQNLWKRVEESGCGEPGFYWTNNRDLGTNPCCEISLKNMQFCNLTEINVSDIVDQEDLEKRTYAAALIGTLQAGYTDFHYLRPEWKENTEKDALLGVGMTGIASGAVLNLNLESAANIAVETNKLIAEKIGINPSARITTIKPSGCLAKNTKIRTSKGELTMEQIFELNGHNIATLPLGFVECTEEIYIYNEDNNLERVTRLFNNGTDVTLKIEMDDGTIFECTKNHRFKTMAGWKRADELSIDDDIISFTSQNNEEFGM